MPDASISPFPLELSRRIREARMKITGNWLERIAARVNVPANSVFPTDELLDHMPLLIEGIADYVADGADAVPADSVVVLRARELGELRHAQGFSEYEILKEFEILGSILFTFANAEAAHLDPAPAVADAIACTARLFRAVALVQQAATARFLELARSKVSEREARLRTFHRALTHEMRNRIGATLGAGQILQMPNLAPSTRESLAGVVVRNADSMRLVLENLLELTRLEADTRQQRHVLLRSAVAEAIRQLREMASSQSVDVQISADLPPVEANAAVVEFCITNLVANAIKYADPKQTDRWVRISAAVDSTIAESAEVVVTVEDNGIGIPEHAFPRLFERFYRAHDTATSVEGTGLGLSLVREATEAIGGRAWAELPEVGARFRIAIPARRSSDLATLASSAPAARSATEHQ